MELLQRFLKNVVSRLRGNTCKICHRRFWLKKYCKKHPTLDYVYSYGSSSKR